MPTLLFQPDPSTLPADRSSSDDRAPKARRSLLLGGFHLLLANKRLLLWQWCASLLCALLATLPFAQHISSYLNHSLASQAIAGRIDLSYVVELLQQAGKHGGISTTPPLLNVALYTLINFILAAGALFVFQSGARPRLSLVTEAGLKYFWRFVRLAIVAAIVIGLTLWLLTTLRDSWLMQASKTHVSSAIFLRSSLTLAAILLIVLLLRFYFDLAEAVVVQLGISGDRRVRRSFPASLRVLRGNFLRAFLSYFLIGTLGVTLFALCIYIWVAALSPYSTTIAFLLGQLGITSLLAARLWQRAALASLTLQNVARIIPPAASVSRLNVASPLHEAAIEPRPIW